MGVFYRLLGLVARLNAWLGRHSVNLIPVNWALIFGIGFVASVCSLLAYEAALNSSEPRAMSLNEVLDRDDLLARYVTVQAPMFPGAALVHGKKHRGGVEQVQATYVPMLNHRRRILLVRFKGDARGRGMGPARVTGMLHRPPRMLKTKVAEMGGSLQGIPVDLDYVLDEGAAPGNVAAAGLGAGVSGLLLALLAIVVARRNVIFRRTVPDDLRPPELAPAPATEPEGGIDLRVSGRFGLGDAFRQRFLEVPAALGTLPTGEVALVSQIDASKRFMGTVTQERKGSWTIVMRPDTVLDPELGRLYLGLNARPALRLAYTDAESGRLENVILSVPDEAQRDLMVQRLSRLCGRTLTPI